MRKIKPLIRLSFAVATFLCAILLFAPLNAAAAPDDIRGATTVSLSADAPAYNEIYNGLASSAPQIKLLSYNISPTDLEELYFRVMCENPELFYVIGRVEFTTNSKGVVVNIMPQYTLSGAELQTARQTYKDELDKIVSSVPPELSDLEKVLYINDYFTTHFSYDTSETGDFIYDAYGLLTKKTGVCQAYSTAFIAVMKEIGIPSGFVVSERDPDEDVEGHMWNLVLLDDHWYHLDITWNDPVSDMPGRSIHSYFLLSDEAMAKTGYHRWEKGDIACTDTTYDNYFWHNVKSPFVYNEGSWYYINNQDFKIYRYNFETETRTFVTAISARWPVHGKQNYFWSDCYSGLGFYQDFLLYNVYNGIFACNPKTGQSYSILQHEGQGESICYFTMDEDGLTYYIYVAPGEGPVRVVSLEQESLRFSRTVTYFVDDEEYAVQTYVFGEAVLLPEMPQKNDHVFSGWEPSLPEYMSATDLVVYAVFTKLACSHDETYEIIIPATCTANGRINILCADCETLLSSEVVLATGHTFGQWVTVPATCTTNGSKTRKCSTCGHSESETIAAHGHSYLEWQVIVEPTNTSQGMREKKCSICGGVVQEVLLPTYVTDNTDTSDTDKHSGDSDSKEHSVQPGVSDSDTGRVSPPAGNSGTNSTIIFMTFCVMLAVVSGTLIVMIWRPRSNR